VHVSRRRALHPARDPQHDGSAIAGRAARNDSRRGRRSADRRRRLGRRRDPPHSGGGQATDDAARVPRWAPAVAGRSLRRRAVIAPARIAAYDILSGVSSGGADLPTAIAAARVGLNDDRDRALAAEIATGVQRWRAALDHLIVTFSKRSLDR